GAQVIKLKGGAGFAVGLSIRDVIDSIILDKRRILPVSTLLHGAYGLHDVCLSVPTEVGCGGARKHIELALTPKERMGLQNSARVLRETIDTVEARLAGGPKMPSTMSSPVQGRVIPRAAWALKK
ncbi:MAG: hypothetical protein L0215_05780, partial [Gemmataceae bacterium]|nr:hypothetical protein [Gemmataceae bacterium]